MPERNGRFRDLGRNAARRPPRLRSDAALAIAASAHGGFVLHFSSSFGPQRRSAMAPTPVSSIENAK